MTKTRRSTNIPSDDEVELVVSQRKRLTYDEEDQLLSIILQYYDEIENKSTDKHLRVKR